MIKIKSIIGNIIPGSFLSNITTLMTGTVFSQVLIVTVAPILSRLYTPNEMGVFTLYTSILGVLGIFECWRYYLAIPLPEHDEEAINIMVLSIIIALFMTSLFFILVVLYGTDFASLLKSPVLSNWLWFLPVSLLASGIFTALNYWCARKKQFKIMAMRQITQNGITAGMQLSLKPLFPALNSGGLIVGYVIGQLVATTRMAFQVAKNESYLFKALHFKTVLKMMKRYKDFPLYNMPGALLNTGAYMVPALVLGIFYGPQVVGLFGLGNRVLGIPSNVIGTAVGQAFLPRAVEASRSGDLPAITKKIYKSLVRISFVPMILLMIVAPELFAFVFGADWNEAGVYVRCTGFWLLIRFVYAPISLLYNVLEKQKDFLVVSGIQTTLFLTVIILGGMHFNATVTIAMLGVVGFLFYFGSSSYILHFAGISLLNILKWLVSELVYALPYASVPVIIGMLSDNSLLYVATSILTGIVFLFVEGRKFKINMIS
jgi:lipopolysaccharide exporter